MNLFKSFDNNLGKYMRKTARPLGGMESSNPRHWRGRAAPSPGGGVCWLFVLLWMDSWCHELMVCKKWYKNNLKMRLMRYFLIHVGVHHTSEVRPRASLVRFLWSIKTLISCPHSIPLNSFSVSTMAKSSISVTLYFCCILNSFLLKNASCWRMLLACYPELSRLPTVLRRHPCTSQKALESLDRLGLLLLR